MPIKNPTRPGRIVKNACLEPLGLSVTEGAKVLGVTRQTLTKIINGKSGISAEMAIRLGESVLAAQQTFGYACRPLMILPRSATDESKIKVRRPAYATRTSRAVKMFGRLNRFATAESQRQWLELIII